MSYIESGRAKMRIQESVAKEQGRVDLERGVLVGVRGGGGGVEARRIDNAAVRESQIRRLGELRSNRY